MKSLVVIPLGVPKRLLSRCTLCKLDKTAGPSLVVDGLIADVDESKFNIIATINPFNLASFMRYQRRQPKSSCSTFKIFRKGMLL